MAEAFAALDGPAVLALLPQQEPFRFVDEILEVDDDHIVARYTFRPDADFYRGHFPGNPITPGVLLIEAMAQTAGAIALNARARERPGSVFFVTIDKAKFRRPVQPGDRVELHMTKTAQRRDIVWYSGRALVDGALVCEAEVSAKLGD